MRRFLWGGSGDSQKTTWVGWTVICKSVRYGGLGIGFLEWRTKALLLKWFWRFGREKDELWRRLICMKFGLQSQYIMPVLDGVRSTSGSCIAKDFLLLWREKKPEASEFINGLVCRLGNGREVRFWTDVWCGVVSLQIRFPRVFAFRIVFKERSFSGRDGKPDG